MAEGRQLFRIYPHNIFFPGIFLALTVLAVNMRRTNEFDSRTEFCAVRL